MNLISLRRPTLAHLLFVVLLLVAASQLAVGYVLYRRLEAQLEADLAGRLVHVSTLLTQSVDGALVAQFRAGDEGLPAYDLVRRRLQAQIGAAGASRAYLVDASLLNLVDTEQTPPGTLCHRLLVHRGELDRAAAGTAEATRLYADEEGRLRLSAFAPVRDRTGRVRAVLGVDAPPAFFAPLAALQREMLLLGAIGLALVGLGGTLVIRQVDRRLRRLRSTVTRATTGESRGARRARDQIGALGRDLDELVAALVATREYQAAVLGSVDVGLVTTDADGHVTYANPKARQLLGRDEFVGRGLGEVFSAEPALGAFARNTHGAPAPLTAEVPFAGGLAGGGRVVAVSASPLVQDDETRGVVLSLLDVTDLRRSELRARENERLASLGGMAGGLLHELGNPLAGLTIYLDLLRSVATEGEACDILQRAIREATRLQEFLADFRVFAGLGMLRKGPVDLREIVSRAKEPLALASGIELAVQGEGNARGDARLLAHAVRNLLRNAMEALPGAGHVRVDLSLRSGEAQVRVTDDGPGLSAEAIARVLEPFHTTKPHGSGLGLLIARRVAELHGGQLEARNLQGCGASFTLRWPADDSATENPWHES